MSTTDHDESKLPRWAQETLRFLRDEIQDLKAEKQQIQNAHAILHEREWVTLPGPMAKDQHCVKLWVLNQDDPLQVAMLFRNDVLMIGRGKR